MTIIINIIIFILAFYLQGSAAGHLNFFGFVPNLVLIFILSITLYRHEYEIYLFAFGAGLILDVISGGPFGINTCIMMLIAFVGNIFKDMRVSFSIGHTLLFVASSALVYYSVYGLYLGIASHDFSLRAGYFYLGQILITVALAFVLFPILSKLFAWENHYEERGR